VRQDIRVFILRDDGPHELETVQSQVVRRNCVIKTKQSVPLVRDNLLLLELGNEFGLGHPRVEFDCKPSAECFDRSVKTSFSKTAGNKALELGGVSPSNDLTRYKMESIDFYLT
jgi:hypothetical protein